MDIKQGQLNLKHVLHKFEIHIFYVCHVHSQHHSIHDFRNCSCIQVPGLNNTSLTSLSSLDEYLIGRLHENLLHLLYRLETVDIRNPRGMAKVLGTLISLAGVMITTLYKGPEVGSWKSAPIHIIRTKYVHENWIIGPILAVVSCLTWSSWFIMQVYQ